MESQEQIGIREGRRIKGRYTITSDDLITGAKFEDAVCRVNFNVDIHSLDGEWDKSWSDAGVKVKPYDIPLRSLIAKDVDGLMMAGRCISGDFFAHASYRVTGNAVAMGEAAGKVAETCHQVHGAMGFTYEHSLHHATRRLWAWREEFGNETHWATQLGHMVAARGADALWPFVAAR